LKYNPLPFDYQPWGKFKTKRLGPWTPLIWQVRLGHIRWVTGDALGHEPGGGGGNIGAAARERTTTAAPVDDVTSVWVYKRLSLEYQLLLQLHQWGSSSNDASLPPLPPIPILTGQLSDASSSPLQIHVALQCRKQHHGEILAVQVNATIPRLQLEIHAAMVPHLAHAMAGLSFLLCKDRAFSNPLKPAPAPKPALVVAGSSSNTHSNQNNQNSLTRMLSGTLALSSSLASSSLQGDVQEMDNEESEDDENAVAASKNDEDDNDDSINDKHQPPQQIPMPQRLFYPPTMIQTSITTSMRPNHPVRIHPRSKNWQTYTDTQHCRANTTAGRMAHTQTLQKMMMTTS